MHFSHDYDTYSMSVLYTSNDACCHEILTCYALIPCNASSTSHLSVPNIQYYSFFYVMYFSHACARHCPALLTCPCRIIWHSVPYCTVLPYDACAIYAPYIPVCTQSYSLISCYSIALLSSHTCMCPALITRRCYIFRTCPCSALVTC